MLILISLGGLFIRNQELQVKRVVENKGKFLVRSLAYNSEYAILTVNKKLLSKFVKGVIKEPEVVYCLVQDMEGEVLAFAGEDKAEKIFERMGRNIIGELSGEKPCLRYCSSEENDSVCDISSLIITQRIDRRREAIGLMGDSAQINRDSREQNLAIKNLSRGEIVFTPLEKAADFNRWSLPIEGDSGIPPEADSPLAEKPPSPQTVREQSSLTGFTEEERTPKVRKVRMVKESIGVARVGVSLSHMNRQINRVKKMAILIIFLVAIITLLLFVFLVRLIVNPVRQLLLGTKRIAGGDLKYRVNVKSNDEIGDLADSFNQMASELEKSRVKIEVYSRILEQEVEQRTAQLKEAQVQIIQSAKMAAVGQLGAGVAHELNNPLGGILGYSQFMLEKFRKPGFTANDFKNCKEYLELIEKETIRCKKIVETLLKFSRKSLFDKFDSLDINKLLGETLAILDHQLKLENIKVSVNFKSDLANVKGIANPLQQVFTNLILNAQQAMPKGGELKITAENIIDEKTKLADKVKIEFTDTGYGIPRENLSRLFDPFFTTKEVEKSVGLGLSVSYQIVQDHNGTIEARSQEGKGSTFILILPVAHR